MKQESARRRIAIAQRCPTVLHMHCTASMQSLFAPRGASRSAGKGSCAQQSARRRPAVPSVCRAAAVEQVRLALFSRAIRAIKCLCWYAVDALSVPGSRRRMDIDRPVDGR